MNTEELSTIYKRAMEYCKAAFGSEPYYLRIENDGQLAGVWPGYSRDDDDDYQYFSVDVLTADLDAVYAERKIKEEEAAEIQRQHEVIRKKKQAEQEKERRRSEYLKLKKEFD